MYPIRLALRDLRDRVPDRDAHDVHVVRVAVLVGARQVPR